VVVVLMVVVVGFGWVVIGLVVVRVLFVLVVAVVAVVTVVDVLVLVVVVVRVLVAVRHVGRVVLVVSEEMRVKRGLVVVFGCFAELNK